MWPFPEYLPHEDPQCVGRYSYIVRDDTGRPAKIVECHRDPVSETLFSNDFLILNAVIAVLAFSIFKLLWWLFTTEFDALNPDTESVEEQATEGRRESNVVPGASASQGTRHLSWLDVQEIKSIVQDTSGSRLYYVQWKGYGDDVVLTWQRANEFLMGSRYTRAYHQILNEFKAKEFEKNPGKAVRKRPGVRFDDSA